MYQPTDPYLQVAKYRNVDDIRRASQWQMARDAQRRLHRERALRHQEKEQLVIGPARIRPGLPVWRLVLRSLRLAG